MDFRQRHVWVSLTLLLFLPFVRSQEDLCAPSFGYEKFMSIDEDTEVGTVILTLNTSGTTDNINLTLKDIGLFGFHVDSQELYVRQQLDADSGGSLTKYLSINCKEAGKAPVDISVIVTLFDVNDNPPHFAQDHYYLALGETTSVGQSFNSKVSATDQDNSFNNRAVYYTVGPGQYSDYFQFPDSLEPVLVLQRALDYEGLANITITIIATNSLSSVKLNSSCLLTIMVQDEDDLNPVFTSPLYEGLVLETALTNTIVNVTPAIQAADADVTLMEPVTYSFHDQFFLFDRDAQGSQNIFSIDPDTAQVRLVGSIQPTKVSIVVQATQKDNPSRYGVAMLVITVAGVNSNAPRFHQDVYQVFVSEAVPPHTPILFVGATDDDFGAAIRYSIVGENSIFDMNSESGAINITGQLDYEIAQSYSFMVQASDGNMNSTAKVEVTVLDTNDNPPVIPDQQVDFDLDRTPGHVITQIQAQDADAGTKLNYRLENYDNLFSIDDSGNLRIVAESADLTETVYHLLVVVTDDGRPSLQSSVLVTASFPPLAVKQCTAMAGPSDHMPAIALGVIAAILLLVVIILIVYICRRRNKNSEQLDKARANRSPDPRGLMFKNANRNSRQQHIHFQTDDCSDSATTVQDNPLKDAGSFNFGFVHPDDTENNRHLDEIHIETEVIPYMERPNRDEMYQQDEGDSSEYGDSQPPQHNLMKGLYPDTSTESLNTSLTTGPSDGIRQHLIANGITSFGTTSFGKQAVSGGVGAGSNGVALNSMALEGLDPDLSVAPREQKSELTVYF